MRKIKKDICLEELISRLPALFAYLEEDDSGVMVLRKATTSSHGCWGKIVESIKLPTEINLIVLKPQSSDIEQIEETTPTTQNNMRGRAADGDENTITLLKQGDVYSYRTLMNYYYQYKDYEFSEEEDDSFISFMDDGIGKVEVPDDVKTDSAVLCPSYIYLSEATVLYAEYSDYKATYDYYCPDGDDCDINKLDPFICCKCKRYREMGGDGMYDWLKERMTEADTVAEKYLDYAVTDEEDTCRMSFSINLTQSVNDLGYVSTYLNNWIPGEKYVEGELVTYDNKTWQANKETTGKYNEETMEIDFPTEDFDEIKSEKSGDDSVNGYADSKLKTMRRFNTFVNDMSSVDGDTEPPMGEDWLYFYRKGLVTYYEAKYDEWGNILKLSKLEEGKEVAAGPNDGNDLAVFGNAITDITRVKKDATETGEAEYTLTFTYYIGAHLKVVKSDDGTSDLVYDENNTKYGVKYTETYNYEKNGEIYKMKDGHKPRGEEDESEYIYFEDYIEDKTISFNKFPFSTAESLDNVDIVTDTGHKGSSYIGAEYEYVLTEKDEFQSPVFKTDYLDGIHFKPELDVDVDIQRGNYSAFERHISLGSIKTMEDMEQFRNGSFFIFNDQTT